ncbi:hypothetical protein BRARA_D02461 [Brassica rapa]|uniref:Uncharacterized protein n=1 Tax=Brassica campestris TaxID=3711 RepID=A0A397ZQT0_BRACM|nr:hypothetical protein BRARA_D02461 [Brassica rapa]
MTFSFIIDFSTPYCVGLEIYFHHHHSSFFTEPGPSPSYRITTPTTPSMPLSLAGATAVTVTTVMCHHGPRVIGGARPCHRSHRKSH